MDFVPFVVARAKATCNWWSPREKDKAVRGIEEKIREWENPILVYETLKQLASLAGVPESLLNMGEAALTAKVMGMASIPVLQETKEPDLILELRPRTVLLVELRVDPKHTESRAVIDRCELVVLLRLGAPDRLYELDVDLDVMARDLLLVTLPAFVVALVALAGRAGGSCRGASRSARPPSRDAHVVVALQVHRDLGRPEVVVLAQVEDLADDVDVGGVGLTFGRARASPAGPPRRAPRSGASRCRSSGG